MKNNNDRIKRTLIIAGIMSLLGIAGWTFVEVRNLPAMYVNKMEMSKIEETILKRLNRIEEKLDKILLSNKGSRNLKGAF